VEVQRPQEVTSDVVVVVQTTSHHLHAIGSGCQIDAKMELKLRFQALSSSRYQVMGHSKMLE
jgi:hypothetical protein